MTAGQEMLRTALQSLGTAVAIADPESWEIRFENACFFQWFPPGDDDPDAPLPRRLSALDTEKAATRLAAGRVFSRDTDVKAGARTLSLALDLRRIDTEEGPAVLVEARNVSKQREAEYMLDSYSRMAEKNARELQREKERVEKLLLNIMPRSVYDELKDFGTTTPQRFDSASVLMLDFIGFTDMAKLASGMDHEIDPAQFDIPRFEAAMERCAPRAIAFTSKKAASVFLRAPTGRLALGRQGRLYRRSEIFVLASPSGAATRYWTVAPWRDLAAFLGRVPPDEG